MRWRDMLDQSTKHMACIFQLFCIRSKILLNCFHSKKWFHMKLKCCQMQFSDTSEVHLDQTILKLCNLFLVFLSASASASAINWSEIPVCVSGMQAVWTKYHYVTERFRKCSETSSFCEGIDFRYVPTTSRNCKFLHSSKLSRMWSEKKHTQMTSGMKRKATWTNDGETRFFRTTINRKSLVCAALDI